MTALALWCIGALVVVVASVIWHLYRVDMAYLDGYQHGSDSVLRMHKVMHDKLIADLNKMSPGE